MEVQYRYLQLDEAQALWNMMNFLDNETKFMMYEPGERKEKAGNIDGIKRMIQGALSGDDFLLAAEYNHEIIGFLWAQRGKLNRVLHTAYIVIGIRERFRGMKIGAKLLKRLNQWAKEKNITRLELSVVCSNERAKMLYEKEGFTIEGIRKNAMIIDGVYVDEYYMAKLL